MRRDWGCVPRAKMAHKKRPLFYTALTAERVRRYIQKDPLKRGSSKWSGRRESNSRLNLGKVAFYH